MKFNKKVQTRLADSLSYVEKKDKLSVAMKLADSDLASFEEKGIQAGILKQFNSRVMDSEEGRDFIRTNNYGPFLPELLPIIIAWYPNFPLKELICVQDMEQDLAYIITSELLTATNKAPTLAGDAVETPNGLRTIKGSYPTGEIMGELLKDDDLDVDGQDTFAALYYFPLVGTTEALESTLLDIEFSVAGKKTFVATSAVGGEITLESTGFTLATAKIEQATGVLTINIPTANVSTVGVVSSVEASYVWNIEFADGKNIPSVVEDMKMEPMIAKPRVIAMKWTIFSELVRKKQFGEDIRTSTTGRVLDLMYQYLVRFILDKMYRFSKGGVGTIDFTGTIIDPNYKAQEIMKNLNKESMIIANNTGRIEGNRVVTGSRFKNYLESLPEQWYTPFEEDKDYGFQGPRKIGKFGKYVIFYDNELPEDEGWMTYRGSQWYDGAYYLGVFMPICPTDAININIDVQQAFVAMEAHKYDKPSAVRKLTFGTGV